jgi:hypothetical protein
MIAGSVAMSKKMELMSMPNIPTATPLGSVAIAAMNLALARV